jgi:hypothetical protein
MSLTSPEQSSGAALGRPTEQQQRIARITGVLWIVTFITSIPAYLLYNRSWTTPASSAARVR